MRSCLQKKLLLVVENPCLQNHTGRIDPVIPYCCDDALQTRHNKYGGVEASAVEFQ